MKKLMVICAPVSSRSGYGDHARDLIWSFLQHDKYDIKILDVRWGDTPQNALDKNNTRDKQLLDCIIPEPKLDRQPDIYIDIRIPNEFQQWGKTYNIGITAGTEFTAIPGEWIEGLNTKQFKDIQKFFDTMPKLKHEITIKNPKTKKESKITLNGLNDFFG